MTTWFNDFVKQNRLKKWRLKSYSSRIRISVPLGHIPHKTTWVCTYTLRADIISWYVFSPQKMEISNMILGSALPDLQASLCAGWKIIISVSAEYVLKS